MELLVSRYGVERACSIVSALRKPGAFYSIRVNTLKISPEELAKRFVARGISVHFHEVLDEVLLIEVDGPFEVPLAQKYVVAEKYAAESVMLGSNLYAPGVLWAKDVEVGDEVHVVDVHGQVVGYGVAKLDGKSMGKGRKGLAVEITTSRFKMPPLRELPEYNQGLFYEQSLPAILTSKVLDPKPGEVIVDMCAAPGGKSTHIAQITRNKSKVYAFESSKARFVKLAENIRRLSASSVEPILSDSRYLTVDHPGVKADRVVVDPPCSALGVRPKLYESGGIESVRSSSSYQRQFLKEGCRVVKPGGVIVYSTCTLMREENEEVVMFAEEELKLEAIHQDIVLGSPGELLPKNKAKLLQRFYPDVHDTPGYFIAKFIKR